LVDNYLAVICSDAGGLATGLRLKDSA